MGDNANHGMPFLGWWREVNQELAGLRESDANRGDAQYFFDREYWPSTAARLIALDRHTHADWSV